ncbi:hypothetical protein I352_00648 [Cryptococcus deuterogattii MMRL2647]|nr:hypothetical protein I352_00648 [Cryptococcus deuterogattii MMRL2647]
MNVVKTVLTRRVPFLPTMSVRTIASPATMSKPRDIQDFLASYPNVKNNPRLSANLKFYLNELSFQPDNLYYDEFMHKYSRDYDELEMNHGYIQWFFPIREYGVNPRAQLLQPHEIEAMQKDPEIVSRLLKSYKMMLGFYGIDFNGGKLKLASNHKQRISNLRAHSHNLLRLTRILKHLSEFPQLQPHAAALVLFFVVTHSAGVLDFSQGVMRGDSMDQWWSNCFRDEKERKEIRKIVQERGRFGQGTWGWEEYNQWYEQRRENGKVGFVGED